ncbi:hypothetical protein E2C01_043839 [Portunus trituberculatus]|uniref:Uncharacterized protein n=1 Tax=Portunus trituberculatus TaxID=210409 RepID=A0A5B7FQH7_PORTR|nr:hypothetical protein [Portunus trituberculatus]
MQARHHKPPLQVTRRPPAYVLVVLESRVEERPLTINGRMTDMYCGKGVQHGYSRGEARDRAMLTVKHLRHRDTIAPSAVCTPEPFDASNVSKAPPDLLPDIPRSHNGTSCRDHLLVFTTSMVAASGTGLECIKTLAVEEPAGRGLLLWGEGPLHHSPKLPLNQTFSGQDVIIGQVNIRLVFACGALMYMISVFIPRSCLMEETLLSMSASQAVADSVVTLGTLEAGIVKHCRAFRHNPAQYKGTIQTLLYENVLDLVNKSSRRRGVVGQRIQTGVALSIASCQTLGCVMATCLSTFSLVI